MTAVGQVAERTDRPAYVRFQRRPMQDHQASLRENKYVSKDVDYALITPPYSKDVVEMKAETWLTQMDADVRNDRLPAEWRDRYKEMYAKFKAGEELPVHGTPIKGWGVLSPAQQENLIRMNILTVEDLAGINDEGCRRIGMGAMDLKHKATTWLAQLNDLGPLTFKVAGLEKAVADKDVQIAALHTKVTLLENELRKSAMAPYVAPVVQPHHEDITAEDILPRTI